MRISKQTSLSLKAKGITSGIVIESGHGVSQLVPIFQDYIIDNCMKELNHVSGVEIDSQIEKYLSQSSLLNIRTDRDTDMFREFKMKFGKINLESNGNKNEFFRKINPSLESKGSKLGRGFMLKVNK